MIVEHHGPGQDSSKSLHPGVGPNLGLLAVAGCSSSFAPHDCFAQTLSTVINMRRQIARLHFWV